MQAWNQVKVVNGQSGYVGQAGYVVRVEKQGDETRALVNLDTTGETVPFDPAELQIL